MGIFSRLGNMTKAKVNGVLDDMENPIELLDQKIRDMEKSFNEAKMSSAQVLGNTKQTEKKMKEAEAESQDWDAKVRLAMSKGDEGLAKKALERKLEADSRATTLKASYEQQKAQGEVLKKRLSELDEEITKTRKYRDEASARLATADAGAKVSEILADVETHSNSIQLDSIERKIAQKESLAEGLSEIAERNSLEDEFAEMAKPDLDAELEKYRTK